MEFSKHQIEAMEYKGGEIKFKDEECKKNYEHTVEVNSKDGYGKGIVNFMNRWAKCMQYLIEYEGFKVGDAAAATEFSCDFEGMSGFSFGCAVQTLCKYWAFGDELKDWHNNKFNYKGKGVVNPAILTTSEEK